MPIRSGCSGSHHLADPAQVIVAGETHGYRAVSKDFIACVAGMTHGDREAEDAAKTEQPTVRREVKPTYPESL